MRELFLRIDKLRNAIAGRKHIVALADDGWKAQWVPEIVDRLSRMKSGSTSIVLLATPCRFWQSMEADEALEGKVDVISLKPWDDAALRQWIDDCQFGPQERAGRDKIREITGNWPYLLRQFRKDPSKDWEQQLSGVAELVRTRSPRSKIF